MLASNTLYSTLYNMFGKRLCWYHRWRTMDWSCSQPALADKYPGSHALLCAIENHTPQRRLVFMFLHVSVPTARRGMASDMHAMWY